MYSDNKTTALTTTGLFLALSIILYFVGVLFPSFGTYLRYLIPGLMAVLKTKYGYRYLTAFSFALLIMVAIFFGIEQLIIGLFLYIPVGFVLASLYENNTIVNHLVALVIFAVFGILLVVLVSLILGFDYKEMYMDVVELNYVLFGNFYERSGLSKAYFSDLFTRLIWFVLAATGVFYGYILYFINKIVYKKGLEIIDRRKES